MDTLPRSAAVARITAARAAYAAIRPRVVDGGPWALAADFGTGPEATWGPREALAHIAEMLSFWYGQHGIIVEAGRGPGDAVPFGRTTSDEARLIVIGRDRVFPVGDLFDLVDDGIARWERRAAATTDAQGSAVGLHPRLGEMTADQVRDRMVVSHLEVHLAQLEATLGRS
jgi:hypothetical protein